MRDLARTLAARLALAAPAARYGRCLLVLSHMRAASTALSNVLCSHAEISGYGETHVPHLAPDAPGRLLVNLARRRAWSPGSAWLFDKVLHDRLDAEVPPAFARAHAIVLVRRPAPAIRSIVALAGRTGLAQVAAPEGAAAYYAARVERLLRHWEALPPARRLGLASEALLADPEAELARISEWLGLEPPLRNAYRPVRAAAAEGAGDPTRSAGLRRIEPQEAGAPEPLEGLPENLARRCEEAHARLLAAFAG